MNVLRKIKQFAVLQWRECKGPLVYWDLFCIFVGTPVFFAIMNITGFLHASLLRDLFLSAYAAGILASCGATLPYLIVCLILWSLGIFRPVMAFLMGPVGTIIHLVLVHVFLWSWSADTRGSLPKFLNDLAAYVPRRNQPRK